MSIERKKLIEIREMTNFLINNSEKIQYKHFWMIEAAKKAIETIHSDIFISKLPSNQEIELINMLNDRKGKSISVLQKNLSWKPSYTAVSRMIHELEKKKFIEVVGERKTARRPERLYAVISGINQNIVERKIGDITITFPAGITDSIISRVEMAITDTVEIMDKINKLSQTQQLIVLRHISMVSDPKIISEAIDVAKSFENYELKNRENNEK